jgi:hypothetical protein
MPYCKWGPEYRPLVYGDTSEFFSSSCFFQGQTGLNKELPQILQKLLQQCMDDGFNFEHNF